jgi:hypothetical protein
VAPQLAQGAGNLQTDRGPAKGAERCEGTLGAGDTRRGCRRWAVGGHVTHRAVVLDCADPTGDILEGARRAGGGSLAVDTIVARSRNAVRQLVATGNGGDRGDSVVGAGDAEGRVSEGVGITRTLKGRVGVGGDRVHTGGQFAQGVASQDPEDSSKRLI